MFEYKLLSKICQHFIFRIIQVHTFYLSQPIFKILNPIFFYYNNIFTFLINYSLICFYVFYSSNNKYVIINGFVVLIIFYPKML